VSLATTPDGLDPLIAGHGEALLDVAVASVRYGLAHGKPLPVRAEEFAPALRKAGASFVTLHAGAALRGCIGTARAWRALIADVAGNGFAAAFEDPRFDEVTPDRLGELDIELSLLGAPVPIAASSEAELIAALAPGRDGVILSEGARRSLFLPQVWDTVPDPAEFLRHLKDKAGWDKDYWSPCIVAERFEVRTLVREGAWAT
jgi:AmmeMemoRadiSam system protein A